MIGNLREAGLIGALLERGRHSLVTPIDWKRRIEQYLGIDATTRRHSLVTPIDWKPATTGATRAQGILSRHSLVTPIDWKPGLTLDLKDPYFDSVAILW